MKTKTPENSLGVIYIKCDDRDMIDRVRQNVIKSIGEIAMGYTVVALPDDIIQLDALPDDIVQLDVHKVPSSRKGLAGMLCDSIVKYMCTDNDYPLIEVYIHWRQPANEISYHSVNQFGFKSYIDLTPQQTVAFSLGEDRPLSLAKLNYIVDQVRGTSPLKVKHINHPVSGLDFHDVLSILDQVDLHKNEWQVRPYGEYVCVVSKGINYPTVDIHPRG